MTYSIDDGDGNQLTTGLQEHEVREVAQRLANSLGETVYVYSEGSEYESVDPDGTDDED